MAAQEGISLLRRFWACPWMQIPRHLDVWHSRGCWAKGDYKPVCSSSGAQLWILGDCSSCPPPDLIPLALSSPDLPPAWAEAFFTVPAGPVMLSHRSSQQDRDQLHWQGTVAATDSSLD